MEKGLSVLRVRLEAVTAEREEAEDMSEIMVLEDSMARTELAIHNHHSPCPIIHFFHRLHLPLP